VEHRKWIEGITGPAIFQDLNAPENTVNTADVLRTRQCNRLLKDYSTEAKAVWEREEDDLLARHQECKAISKKVFSEAVGFLQV